MNEGMFEGFVLAGGRSSRMGADKAFLMLRGETFLERAANALRPLCGGRVTVVLNRGQRQFAGRLPADTRLVFDIFEERGALGGIHAALKTCRAEFAVILACDMPLVTSEVICRLGEMAASTPEAATVVPRQTDGRLQPLCAVYRTARCLASLEDYLSAQRSNAVGNFLETIQISVADTEILSPGSDPFVNVNYRSEYEKLKS